MKIVEKDKEYTLKIDSVSSEGHGVAHIDGFTVFIPRTAAGDTVRAVIRRVQKRFARAELVSITAPSADRQKPDCPVYSQCGGCQLRHIKYEKQLEIKRLAAENAMRRIGHFNEFSIDEIIAAERTERYRNKMFFPAGEQNGKSVCGFYAPKSHDIIPLGDCLLGDEVNQSIIEAVTDYMNTIRVPAYDNVIRRVFTRTSSSTGEIMTVIVASDPCMPNINMLIDKLRSVSDRITSIILNINTSSLPLGDKNLTIWGKSTIRDTLCGIDFEISPNSFFQINPIETEKLYKKALEFAQLDGGTRVMDIYCGIGTISLYAARTAKSVIGIEVVEQAINNAKNNAERNGISNAEFYAGKAEEIVPELVADERTAEVIILDPPRNGSDEKTLSAIVQAEPKRIVYVSCNPATLARDARFLDESGYKIKRSAAFDLFPNTTHIETVILLENS